MTIIPIVDSHPALEFTLAIYSDDGKSYPVEFVNMLPPNDRQLALRWSIAVLRDGKNPHIAELAHTLLHTEGIHVGMEEREIMKVVLLNPTASLISEGSEGLRACAIRANGALPVEDPEILTFDERLYYNHSYLTYLKAEITAHLAELPISEQSIFTERVALANAHTGEAFASLLEGQIPGGLSEAARAMLIAVDG